jgi:hypothetical protein
VHQLRDVYVGKSSCWLGSHFRHMHPSRLKVS